MQAGLITNPAYSHHVQRRTQPVSVKKKDRHVSGKESLERSRALVNYILVLTRPRRFDKRGKQIQKPGILAEGQAYSAFGLDILTCGKKIHAACYQGVSIHLKDIDTLTQRREHFNRGIEYCNVILRLVDLCIYQYALYSAKKQRSFEHLAQLVRDTKISIQDRINRDNLIYEQKYAQDEKPLVNF